MKKNYENPIFDLKEIEEIETADNNVSTTPGVEDDLNFWPI